MKLSDVELVLVALIIIYIAFFTRPVPGFISSIFKSPIGHALVLSCIVYVAVYESLIVAIFLALAYVMTNMNVTEYLTTQTSPNPTTQTSPNTTTQTSPNPTTQTSPNPTISNETTNKKDEKDKKLSVVPESQSKAQPIIRPTETTVPKGSESKKTETFATFN